MAYYNSYLMWSDPFVDGDLSTDIFSMPIEAELILAGKMAVRKGAWVEATDGHIGRVCEVQGYVYGAKMRLCAIGQHY